MSETATPAAPAPAPAAGTPTATPKKRGGPPKPLIVLVIVAAIGYGVWKEFLQPAPVPEGVVQLSGRIEGDDSAIAPKTAGRIAEIRFREGDMVKAGETIATLDDSQTKSREDQARSSVSEGDARVTLAERQIAVLQEQLRENELQMERRSMPTAACGKPKPTSRPLRRSWRSRKPP